MINKQTPVYIYNRKLESIQKIKNKWKENQTTKKKIKKQKGKSIRGRTWGKKADNMQKGKYWKVEHWGKLRKSRRGKELKKMHGRTIS